MQKGFERVHHFHGQRLEVADFEEGQRYFIERRRLHQKLFHGGGVVTGFLGGLAVSALGRGDLSLVVEPGLAVDGSGREILLPARQVVALDIRQFRPPQVVTLVIRRVEEPVDFVEDPECPEYKGHRRVLEKARLDLVEREAETATEVELARIRLEEGAEEIRDPAHPDEPGGNEIDLRFVPRTASATWLAPDLVYLGRGALRRVTALAGEFVGRFDLSSFREARQTAHAAGRALLPPGNAPALADSFHLLFSILREAAREIPRILPRLRGSRVLGDLRTSLDSTPPEIHPGPDPLHRAVRALQEICTHLERFLEEAPLRRLERWRRGDLEAVETRGLDLPPLLEVGERWLKKVDEIDVGDPRSEEEHTFRIEDSQDSWSMHHDFAYPDGVRVADRGRGYVGGSARFVVRNLTPGLDLLLLQRLDSLRGEGVVEVEVAGEMVPERWILRGDDRRRRWRNGALVLQAGLIRGETVEVRLIPVEAERGIRLYRLWFYQPE